MRLTVKDAAQLLEVSDKTIYRWLRGGELPAHRVGDQYRFNRAELLEWATAKRLSVSPDIFREPESEIAALPTVGEALATGGIHYRIGGRTQTAVLRNMVAVLPLPEEVDRDFVFNVISAREALGSTGVGGSIALPHVRNPVVLHLTQPMIALGFLETPIEYGAIDGEPVRILFTLLSPTARAHLHLLARLGYFLRDRRLRRALEEEAGREKIMKIVRELEAELPAAKSEARRTAEVSR